MTNEGTYIMILILRNNRTSVGSLSIVAGEHSLSVDSGNEQTRNIAAKHEYKLSDIYLKHKFIFFFFLLNRHVSYSSRTQENDICLLEVFR